MEQIAITSNEYLSMIWPVLFACSLFTVGSVYMKAKALQRIVAEYCIGSFSNMDKAYFLVSNLDFVAGIPIQVQDRKFETTTFRGSPSFDFNIILMILIPIVGLTFCFWILFLSVIKVKLISIGFCLTISLTLTYFMGWGSKNISRLLLINYYSTGRILFTRKLSLLKFK